MCNFLSVEVEKHCFLVHSQIVKSHDGGYVQKIEFLLVLYLGVS
jgi:hypothetical protein